jgi:hypothetical protein
VQRREQVGEFMGPDQKNNVWITAPELGRWANDTWIERYRLGRKVGGRWRADIEKARGFLALGASAAAVSGRKAGA